MDNKTSFMEYCKNKYGASFCPEEWLAVAVEEYAASREAKLKEEIDNRVAQVHWKCKEIDRLQSKVERARETLKEAVQTVMVKQALQELSDEKAV